MAGGRGGGEKTTKRPGEDRCIVFKKIETGNTSQLNNKFVGN